MASDVLDFTKPANKLKYDAFHVLDHTAGLPESMLLDLYRGLIKARHNTLHYFAHKSMGLEWSQETSFESIFPRLLPDEYKFKTPDTSLQRLNKWWFIDYSISVDFHRMKEIKQKKYGPIVEFLNNNGITAEFIHINVVANYSNLETELIKLSSLQVEEFSYSDFLEICNILDDQKVMLGHKISPESLEKMKKEFISDEDKEFNETNVGTYKDLDVDIEGFITYNQKFDHLDKIKQAIDTCDLSELEGELYKILEDENDPIHQKYMDKKLTQDQFENAFEEIIVRNNGAPLTDPRPSHHMLIPMPDDITHTGQILNEQESILEFAKDFNFFYDENKHKYNHHRLAFLSCVFHSVIDCTTGVDSNVYKSLYDGRKDEYRDILNDFKTLKKARRYYTLFHTGLRNIKDTKKYVDLARAGKQLPDDLPRVHISQNALHTAGLSINKNNTKELWDYYAYCWDVMQKNIGTNSLPDYLYKNGVLKQDPTMKTSVIIGDKKIKMPKDKQPQLIKIALEKAGIKADVESKSRKPGQPRGVIPIDERRIMDNLLDYMSKGDTNPIDYKLYSWLKHKPSKVDSKTAYRLKGESQFDYDMYLERIMETNAYKYSHYSHLAYNQLFHVNEYASDNDTMYMFNMGIDNFCCIVALTRADREGKPFICVVKTSKPELYTQFWGKLNKVQIPNTDYWYVYTNWRRLDNNKITYLRDVHYSVLSSTMNSAMSNPMALKFAVGTRIKELYSFRVLIALSANQKTSELLLDTRYAYMSSISWYTDLGKLIVEKFGYQFNTVIEAWIIWRIITKLKEINHAAMSGGIVNYRLSIDLRSKDIQSIGGHIRMPSLWLDYELTDITELLDEAFVYVHTIKEPSNIFHEQVKAIQTIIKFQTEYDSLPDFVKTGSICNAGQLRYFLQNKGYVGCCAPIVYNSVRYTLDVENPNFKQYVHEIADESIGELLSTKAVIPEHKREIVMDKKMSKREIKKTLKRESDVLGIKTKQQFGDLMVARLKVSSRFYNDYKPRQKVWETIMEFLENDKGMERTVHLANYFLKNPMVQADICIKSQYGGKREFYVINITAKALARLTENFFRRVSKNSDHEAISIPGDKKVMRMQRMLDSIHTLYKTENHEIIYTNGDCTKWSAAETMQSFLSMTYAFHDKIPLGMYNVMIATYNAWTDKRIQLPMDVYNKVVPSVENNTGYLRKLKEKNMPQLPSSQNFLQGMFNYSSSYKAVCCNTYTYSLWRKFYPNSNLKIEHLEHSDDYVTVCLYTDIKEFEKYRLLNKMIMRLHGYNDSERKTCSQPFIMEFVSQMSHNGVMLYPQIKKSKEINLSLPCTGYTKDMDAAMSRVGECSRVGCNLSFLYFFTRLHSIVVAEAYSILPGMKNNMNRTLGQLMAEPIELFGIPDTHPIFSLYCRGNMNNYRLYHYGDNSIKDKIRKLYKKSLYISSVEGVTVEKEDDRYCLATPRFLYDMGNKTLTKLKKNIGIPIDDVRMFWEKHPVYKLLKPKTNEILLTWVKAMFYNRTFMEAYSTTTRARMTLRIPKYVSKQMIVEAVELEKHYEKKYKWDTKILTMVEYYDKMSRQIKDTELIWDQNDEIHLTRIITKCDPTVNQIYSILDTLTITLTEMTRKQTIQVSAQQPRKTTTISLANDPSVLLQYILDNECFVLDKRRVLSRSSLEKDVIIIKEKYASELSDTKNTMALLSVYNDLMITRQNQNVVYTYDRSCVTLLDFIMATFRNNYHPGYICKVTHTNIGNVIDPTTLKSLFLKQYRYTKDYHRQCLDNICLIHVLLTQTQGLSKQQTIEILNQIQFNMPWGGFEDYKTILKTITSDYMVLNDFSLTERKMASYLCAYYLNNYDLLNELVNNHYSFSYRYNQKAFKRGDTYVGETIVTFNHFNTVVRAYHDETVGDPIIVMQRHYPSASPTLYNIALRLTNCINQMTYEEDPLQDRRKLIRGFDLKTKIDRLKIPNLNFVVKPGPNDYDLNVKVTKINNEDFYYPVLITNRPLKRGGNQHFSKQKAQPHIDNNILTILLGKSKLFVLPYWRCNQYDNMNCPEILLNGVPFQKMLEQRRMEYYLLSSNKLRLNTNEITLEHTNKKTIQLIKEHIMTQKIYDFKFSDIIRGSRQYVDILDSSGKDRIEGGYVVAVKREAIQVPDAETEDYFITMPHLYSENTMPPKEAPEPMESDAKVESQFTFEYHDMGDFVMDLPDDDMGMPMDEETTMKFDFERELEPKHIDFTIDDDYTYHDYLPDSSFQLDLGEGAVEPDVIVDDTNEDLNEGLNYHLKEYINEDVYHREIHGKIMDDKFLVDPRTKKRVQKTWKKNEYKYYSQMGSNYMVLRLKKIPSLYMTLLMQSHRLSPGFDIMNIYSFKKHLQQVIDIINYIDNSGNISLDKEIIVYFHLEKLLCRTYIVDSLTHKQSVGFAYDINHNLHLGVWTDTHNKMTMEQMNDLLNRGKILAIDGAHILVRTTLERFEKQVETGIKTGVLTFQPLMVSKKADNIFRGLILSSEPMNTDDLLDKLLG